MRDDIVMGSNALSIPQIKGIIKELSRSQWSYGRMYEYYNSRKLWGPLQVACNDNKIVDAVWLILFLES